MTFWAWLIDSADPWLDAPVLTWLCFAAIFGIFLGVVLS